MKSASAGLRLLAGIAVTCVLGLPSLGQADTFSVLNDGVGMTGTGVATTSPDGGYLFDAFAGPPDPLNTVALTPADLGLTGGQELNAVSFGYDAAQPYHSGDTFQQGLVYDIVFSVDRTSQGVAGSDVAWKASTSQQSNSTFVAIPSQLAGVNAIDAEGLDYGLKDVANDQNNDDLDAHDFFGAPYLPGQDGNVYFSIAGSGEIYLNNIGNVFKTAAELGTQGEDLDALAVETDASGTVLGILFSTATAAGVGGAADLFLNNTTTVAYTAADLGLQASDNLNALSTEASVPEPMSMALVGTALLGLLALRRRDGTKGALMTKQNVMRGLTTLLCLLFIASLATNADAHRRRSRRRRLHVPKKDFLIFTNYELGMHCTGFDFSYCCVLPPFNSIQAQAVKTGVRPHQMDPQTYHIKLGYDFADNSTSDPSRLFYWVPYDAGNGTEKWLDGSPDSNVDGDTADNEDTLANVEFDSLYTYNIFTGKDGGSVTNASAGYPPVLKFLEGGKWVDPNGFDPTIPSTFAAATDRISVGGATLNIPLNNGPTFAPMHNKWANKSDDTLDNVPSGPNSGFGRPGLTYVGNEGTVVYTYTKIIDAAGAGLGLDGNRLVDVPVVLTTADLWDAVGLPLTPFNDTLVGSKAIEAVTESDFKPFQEQWVYMYNADTGAQVLQHDGTPVQFLGTAPIDSPACEKCHGWNNTTTSVPAGGPAAKVQAEYDYWIAGGASDYFARVKSAAMSILGIHDADFGTNFLGNYGHGGPGINNSRLGRQSVMCQSCHADNIVGRFQAGDRFCDNVSPSVPTNAEAARYPASRNNAGNQALTYAIHMRHSGASGRTLPDGNGRAANCQACHPAHANGIANDAFPLADDGTLATVAQADIRDAKGCFTNHDAHANRNRDADMGPWNTPTHLNAIGQWYQTNVASDIDTSGKEKGIYCTNCHNRLAEELWLTDAGIGDPTAGMETRPATSSLRDSLTIGDLATALGVSQAELTAKYMDPKFRTVTATGGTNVYGNKGCDLCHGTGGSGGLGPVIAGESAEDLLVATQNAAADSSRMFGGVATALTEQEAVDLASELGGELVIDDTNDHYQYKGMGGDVIPGVPYGVVTDGSDFWASAGEPHCADCHAYPFVESQGGINAPWAEPGKYALYRHSKGHMRLACQSCHESIHGLYPTTTHDPTTRNAALQYSPDGNSYGPVTCAACHVTNNGGVPVIAERVVYKGSQIGTNYDLAVEYMHTVREGTTVLPTTARNPLSTGYGATMIPEAPANNDCANHNNVTGLDLRGTVIDTSTAPVNNADVVFVSAVDVELASSVQPIEDVANAVIAGSNPNGGFAVTGTDGSYTFSGVSLADGDYYACVIPNLMDTAHLPYARREVLKVVNGHVVDTPAFGNITISMTPSSTATYIGSTACLGCHAKDSLKHTLHFVGFRVPSSTPGVTQANSLQDMTGWAATSDGGLAKFAAGDCITFSAKGHTHYAQLGYSGSTPTMQMATDATCSNTGGNFLSATYNVAFTYGGEGLYKQRYMLLVGANGEPGAAHVQAGGASYYYPAPFQWNESGPAAAAFGENGEFSGKWVPPTANGDNVFVPGSLDATTGTRQGAPTESFGVDCGGCHGGVAITKDTNGNFITQYIDQIATGVYAGNIGCERCHGPGSEHQTNGGYGYNIVQPDLLTPGRLTMVCGTCHQRGHGHSVLDFTGAHAGFASIGDLTVDPAITVFQPGMSAAEYYGTPNGSGLAPDFGTIGGYWEAINYTTDKHSWKDIGYESNPLNQFSTATAAGTVTQVTGSFNHSKGHHQQYFDVVRTTMYKNDKEMVTCIDCHDAHGGPSARGVVEEHQLSANGDNNAVCLGCHNSSLRAPGAGEVAPTDTVGATAIAAEALEGAHPANFQFITQSTADDLAAGLTLTPAEDTAIRTEVMRHVGKWADATMMGNMAYTPVTTGMGRCTNCHMPKTAKSARTANALFDAGFPNNQQYLQGDIHSHTFDVTTTEAVNAMRTTVGSAAGTTPAGMTNACGFCHTGVLTNNP